MSASDHPAPATIEAFHRRELPAPALLTLTDHLSVCQECRLRVTSVRGPASDRDPLGLALDPLVDHVPEDEIHAHVRGTLPADRILEIERHLERCAACAAEVRDLQTFAAEVRAGSHGLTPFAIGLAAAAIVLAIGGAWLVQRGARSVPAVAQSRSPSGGEVRFDARGRLIGVESLTADERDAVRTALMTGVLPISPLVRDLQGSSGTLMGRREQPLFTLRSPVDTAVLQSRPTLKWTPAPGARGYIVSIQDRQSGGIVSSAELTTTEWTPAAPLTPGATYRWQVAALLDGREVVAPAPTDPTALFTVLDETSATRIRQLPSSHVVRVVLCARAGLMIEAEHEAAALEASGERKDLAARWMDELRAVRSP